MKRDLTGNELYHTTHANSEESNVTFLGITIRQQFAAQFYAARISGLSFSENNYLPSQVARLSCEDADALIYALNQRV